MAVKKKTAKFKFVKSTKSKKTVGRPRTYDYDLVKVMEFIAKHKGHGALVAAAEKFQVPYGLLAVQLHRAKKKLAKSKRK